MKSIILELKAKHFKEARFCDTGKCPVANVAKETLNTNNISVGVSKLDVGDDRYIMFPNYEFQHYLEDKSKASKLRYSNAVIRKIKLTKV